MAGSASQAGGREVSEVTVIRCTKAPELALWAQAFAPSPQHSVFIPFIQGLFKNKRAGVPWQGAGAASAAPPPLKAPPGMKTVLKSRILVFITSLEGKKTVFSHLTTSFSSSDK